MEDKLKISLSPDLGFDMIYVEGDTFEMGSNDPDGFDREKPIHRVKLSGFYIGKYPVTQQLWQLVMGNNPSHFKGEQRPVETVSWDDIQGFINKLKSQTSKPFRLPTEAEWEYAARGGKYSQGYKFSGSDRLKQVGWYNKNSAKETKEVGLLLANELGINDMSGNVWEWCHDRFGDKYYEECHRNGTVDNPQGAPEGARRVIRGGSFFRAPLDCRSVGRYGYPPEDRYHFIGFRLVLPFQSVG